MVTRMKIFRR